jgi:hypothetical protein
MKVVIVITQLYMTVVIVADHTVIYDSCHCS